MMSYLDELKHFSLLHALAQDIPEEEFAQVLKRIDHVEGTGKGDWGYELSSMGHRLEHQGNLSRAFEYYNLARFPFPQTDIMKHAQQSVVQLFQKTLQQNKLGVQRRICHIGGASVPYYAYFGKPRGNVIFVCGGIISIKEQWKTFLKVGPKLGLNVILAEMPGVGENPLTLTATSSQFISEILNDFEKTHPFKNVQCVTFSFSGTLALQQASKDKRITAITTVGAPLSHFYTDIKNFEHLPIITRKTLMHLSQTNEETLPHFMHEMATALETINTLSIPIYYVASLRDEVIPMTDPQTLKRKLPQTRMVAFDDVHASPAYFKEMRSFVLSSVLRESISNPLLRTLGTIKQWLLLRRYGYRTHIK